MISHLLRSSVVGAMALAAVPLLACDPVVSIPNQATINDYDALAGGFYTDRIRTTVTNNGQSACVGEVRFEAVNGENRLTGPSSDMIAFLIVGMNDTGQIILDPLTLQQIGIRVTIPPRQSTEIRPRFYVLGGQPGRSGTYRASVRAQFVRTSGAPPGAPESSPQVDAELRLRVQPTVQANFVGTDSVSANGLTGGIALGELTPGLRRNLGIQLRANADVDVTVSSTNNGRLKRAPGDAGIGYLIGVNGTNLDLSSAVDTELSASLDQGGRTNPLSIQLENFRNAAAGNYADTITFRITAR
jgi:hypothetical protein